jgi:hypothetical protein
MTEAQALMALRSAAAMTDEEIELRGDQQKESVMLQLQQTRALARLKLKAMPTATPQSTE